MLVSAAFEVGPVAPLRLPANAWYCVEVGYNGATGDTQLFIDGVESINARTWTPGKGNFTFVKFGVESLHAVKRTIWFDDVSVTPSRLGGCP